jgi:hypothetical protein
MESEVDTHHVGRNEPCPCGSGEKFKKCHGISSRQNTQTGDAISTIRVVRWVCAAMSILFLYFATSSRSLHVDEAYLKPVVGVLDHLSYVKGGTRRPSQVMLYFDGWRNDPQGTTYRLPSWYGETDATEITQKFAGKKLIAKVYEPTLHLFTNLGSLEVRELKTENGLLLVSNEPTHGLDDEGKEFCLKVALAFFLVGAIALKLKAKGE